MNYISTQLRLSEALTEKIDSVVRKTDLKKADVLRMAIEIGIDAMLRSKKQPPECYHDYIRANTPGLS